MNLEKPKPRQRWASKEVQMKAAVILVGVLALGFTLFNAATQPPPTDEQVRAERQAQAEKLDAIATVVDLFLNAMTYDGKVTKSDMKQLQKLVDKYKNIPLYKQLKKELNPSKYPSLYLLTTVERITELYFPSLGHSCDKECLDQVRFHFNQLGAEVNTIEPNTSGRDVLIGAIVGFAAAAIFIYWLFRQFSLLVRLKERLDKENTPP